MKNLLIGILFTANLFLSLNAEITQEKTELEEQTDIKRNLMKKVGQSTYSKTWADATDDNSTKNWNTKDFQKHFNANGLGTGTIGNTQSAMTSSDSTQTPTMSKLNSAAMSANPNMVRTDALQSDEDMKEAPSIKAWSSTLQEGLVANTTGNGESASETTIAINETTKCYITRDISVKYKCNKPDGLLYGGTMSENASAIKSSCEDECYDQYECRQVNTQVLEDNVVIDDIEFQITEDLKEMIINETINHEIKVDTINFTTKITGDDKVGTISVVYTTWKDKEVEALSNYRITKNSQNHSLKINDNIKKIAIHVKSEEQNETISIKDIVVTYIKNNKFICPSNQDISQDNGGDFSYVCPSGNTVDFNDGANTYTICADYGMIGDNIDGTYSTLESCNSVCKKNYSCKINLTLMNTAVLSTFREGCIIGEPGCETNTCKDLRLSGAKVLNENVFNAGQFSTQTVVNSTQIPGTKRPRVLLDEDVEFEKRNAEEWKDSAYENMITNGTFKVTSTNMEEDTEASSAYAIGLNTMKSMDGYTTVPTRGLFWTYKPSAFDINAGKTHNFHVVIEVDAERYIYNELGKKVRTKDKILYVKINEEDNFKAFAYKEKFAKNVVVTNELEELMDYQHALNEDAVWEYRTFDKNILKWQFHPSSDNLEKYKQKQMIIDNTYIKEQVIIDFSTFIYTLDGLIRRIDEDGPYETVVYSDKFNGTGHGIGHYRVFAIDAKQITYTYAQIVEMIDNETLKPIYDNLARTSYPQYLKNDSGERNSDINIYTYGAIENKSGYVHIKPKESEVGKKGFLFIFGYEGE